jgi:hypothetical protein
VRRSHRRPSRSASRRAVGLRDGRRPRGVFRVIGVLVLVLGAAGGGYMAVVRHQDTNAAISLDAEGPALGALSARDPWREHASEVARMKAARAAALAAERAKKAQQVAERNQRPASRSQPRTSLRVPSSCAEYAGNRALGCALLLEANYGLAQMPCLDRLWTRESGWNHRSENQSSGAYGIPQALPGNKMATYGSDWRTNPVPQIKWGLNYIENRYNSPCGAWSFFESHNWY